MSKLTLDDYQQQASTTCTINDPGSQRSLAYTALGLSGEAGEVANKVKKILRGDYEADAIQDDIAAELGDVLWYVAMVAREFDLSLNDIAAANLEKLASRKERGVLKGSGDER
jgi:NTP pyrophosphatase (non-canonical NTP hydrolase)